MPTYAYKCRECGNAFDVQQSFTDDALSVCPSCGGALRKVFGTVGVTFNGSGFYRTDSRAAARAHEKGSGKKEPAVATAGESGGGNSSKSTSGAESHGSSAKDSGAKDSGAKTSTANPGAKKSDAKAATATR